MRNWAEANWPSGGLADERKEIGERSRVSGANFFKLSACNARARV